MLQRVQTIYFILAFTCMALLLVFPIFSIWIEASGMQEVYAQFGSEGLSGEGVDEGNLPLSYAFISLALFTAACLLMYKKRPRQLLLTRINLILHILLVIGVYVFYYLGRGLLEERLTDFYGTEVFVSFRMEVGFFLLIPTVAFLFLAIRGIKRDENLVKSLDRIR